MYKLQLPINYRISPSFHVSLLKPLISGPLADSVPHDTPPPPLDIEGSTAYDVRSLLTLWGSAPVPSGLGGVTVLEVLLSPGGDILDPNIIRDFHLHLRADPLLGVVDIVLRLGQHVGGGGARTQSPYD